MEGAIVEDLEATAVDGGAELMIVEVVAAEVVAHVKGEGNEAEREAAGLHMTRVYSRQYRVNSTTVVASSS